MRLFRYLCVLAAARCLPRGRSSAKPTASGNTGAGQRTGRGNWRCRKIRRDAAESKIEQRDFEGARPLLEKYLRQHPADARALFDLGYVEDAGSHEDAAAADYRKAIAADPKQFEARLALGLLLAHQGKYDQAREQMQQATLLTPDPPNPAAQAEAFRTLAELDRSSDPPAARDALVAALRLSPETPGRPAADRPDRRGE